MITYEYLNTKGCLLSLPPPVSLFADSMVRYLVLFSLLFPSHSLIDCGSDRNAALGFFWGFSEGNGDIFPAAFCLSTSSLLLLHLSHSLFFNHHLAHTHINNHEQQKESTSSFVIITLDRSSSAIFLAEFHFQLWLSCNWR